MIMRHSKFEFFLKNCLNRFFRYISDIFGSLVINEFTTSSEIIRNVNERDIAEVLQIYKKCFCNQKYNQIIKYSVLFRKIFYIYEVDGKIIGYAGFYLHLKIVDFKLIHIATLFSIAVDISYQGKGYGKILLYESINTMQKNGVLIFNLYVNKKNQSAISLYKSIGFHIVDTQKDICGIGELCYKMCLDIS